MSDPVDQEIQAIKSMLQALTPLSPKARVSVLDYIAKRLDIAMPETDQKPDAGGGTADDKPETKKPPAPEGSVHIKDLKTQKKPRSANEMAALVAYYLSNLAPQADRKNTVNQKDIETYFKIAEFPLPEQIRLTLPNAKAAGYFDSVGDGMYKLNAVGHNLVVHSMPRGKGTQPKARRARKKMAQRTTGSKSRQTTRT